MESIIRQRMDRMQPEIAELQRHLGPLIRGGPAGGPVGPPRPIGPRVPAPRLAEALAAAAMAGRAGERAGAVAPQPPLPHERIMHHMDHFQRIFPNGRAMINHMRAAADGGGNAEGPNEADLVGMGPPPLAMVNGQPPPRQFQAPGRPLGRGLLAARPHAPRLVRQASASSPSPPDDSEWSLSGSSGILRATNVTVERGNVSYAPEGNYPPGQRPVGIFMGDRPLTSAKPFFEI